MKWSAIEVGDTPPLHATVTSTTPVPGGDTAVIVEFDAMWKVVLASPNLTAVATEKPKPEIVTNVPPR